MKNEIKAKLNDLEIATGIKESGVKFFVKIKPDEAGNKYHAYYYFEDNNGDKTFYKNGSPLTDKELQGIETNCTIIFDDIE